MLVGATESKGQDERQDRQRVYGWLKSATMNYLFRPGEQITVGDVAERLSVSSTPVRETLIRLQGESLLDTTTRRGFFARMLDLREMDDLFQLRFSILRFAVEQLLEFPEKETLALEQLRLRMVMGDDTFQPDPAQDSRQLGLELTAIEVGKLCEALAGYTGNETMVSALRNANDRTHYIRTIDLETPGRAVELRASIEAVLTRLQQSDAGGAIGILRRNLDRQISLLPSLVKEGISRAYLRPSWTKAVVRTAPRAPQRPLVAGRGSATRR